MGRRHSGLRCRWRAKARAGRSSRRFLPAGRGGIGASGRRRGRRPSGSFRRAPAPCCRMLRSCDSINSRSSASCFPWPAALASSRDRGRSSASWSAGARRRLGDLLVHEARHGLRRIPCARRPFARAACASRFRWSGAARPRTRRFRRAWRRGGFPRLRPARDPDRQARPTHAGCGPPFRPGAGRSGCRSRRDVPADAGDRAASSGGLDERPGRTAGTGKGSRCAAALLDFCARRSSRTDRRCIGGGRVAAGLAARRCRATRECHAHAERQSVPEGHGQGSPHGRIATVLHNT